MERIRRCVRVRGLVQGVWFRDSTRIEARRHGVDGWVRNCHDGSVEAVFEGPPEAVAALVAWCGRGPPAARVENVECHEEAPENLRGFGIVA